MRLTEIPPPQELKKLAESLLDNEAFLVLLSVRLDELTDDVLLTEDDREVLKAKAEYTALTYLLQWVKARAGRNDRG